MNIVLVYSPAPRQVREWVLVLPPGSTVAQALESSSDIGGVSGAGFRPPDAGNLGPKDQL